MREMRRKKQALTSEEAWAILRQATEGVLSLIDDQGFPYGVPVNYAVDGDHVLVHSALTGRKVDAVRAHPRATLTVIDHAVIRPEAFSTSYRSVIAEGPARLIDDPEQTAPILTTLGLRFNPDVEACENAVAKSGKRCLIMRMDVERLSGKESMDLRNARDHA